MSEIECHSCGEKLYKSEEYTKINGCIYCSCCIDEMDSEKLLKLFDIKLDWEEA